MTVIYQGVAKTRNTTNIYSYYLRNIISERRTTIAALLLMKVEGVFGM